jgi:ribosomal protein S18 acetylase RimI-like enzyme
MIKITKGYKKSDFNSLLRINDLCYSGDERPPKETFARMLEFSEVWVARYEREHKVLELPDSVEGFTVVNESASLPYLWSMAVDPDRQGDGIGKKMLALVCTEYKNRPIELHCRVDNPVQKLYFDYGFRVIDIARAYYKIDGKIIDGLKMRKG